MNTKFLKMGLASLLIVPVLVLSGCNNAGQNTSANLSPEELQDKVKTGFEKWQEADTASFSFMIGGNASAEGEELTFDMTISGDQEIVDREEEKFNVDAEIAGSASMDGEKINFSLGMVVLEDMFYFNLGELSGLENTPEFALIAPAIEAYSDQWWSMELPEEADFAELNPATSLPGASEGEELTPEEEQIKELFEETEFFASIEPAGAEKVDGVKSDKFEVELDKDALIEFMREAAVIQGEEVNEEEVQEMEKVLEAMELEMTVWIAQDEEYVTKLAGGLSGDFSETEDVVVDVEFEVTFTNFNGNVNIEAPADAQVFDLNELGMGGFGPTPDVDYSDSEYDYSELEGLEGMEDFDFEAYQ